jgi:selenocysteine lyase/cysteine desulfurase
MLACQREHFDIPRDVAYLNAAAWSPLPRAVVAAGQRGVLRKARPWELPADHQPQQFERARGAAAKLINADPNDVALISSVGYGVSTAAKILPVPKGSRVLLLQDDHSSPVLEWMTRAEAGGFSIETVAKPADGDWTNVVLDGIARKGAAPVSVVSISSIHWSDGGMLDMARIAPAVHAGGAHLIVDATHGAGVVPLDVAAIDPDVVIFPTYKWLLGPYGRAFLYVAKRHQHGVPLEQTPYGRRAVEATQAVYLEDTRYVSNARRFDMGERDHFVSLDMAATGIETMLSWGMPAVSARLGMLTRRLADSLEGLGLDIPAERVRAPHILSVAFPGGLPEMLEQRLASDRAYAALRLGRLRISPHVYNDEADVDRFVAVLRQALGRG